MTLLNVNITYANKKDTKILNKLFSELLEDDRLNYDHNIKTNLTMNNYFEKRINLNDSIILVAKINKEILGYIYGYVRTDNKIKQDLEANIDSLYVVKEYRNSKVGTNLINRFIEEVKKRNVKYVFIENKRGNKIANNLYTKLGFYNFIETKRIEV